jgi:hypothetical protein
MARTKPTARGKAASGANQTLNALEARHADFSASFARREDRFSRLLSKILQDQLSGGYLVTRNALTAEEHAELMRLRPEANQAFRTELSEAIDRLRVLLSTGDPFFILATVQNLNMFTPWGAYFEPTHEGSEAKVELVSGLLATQPIAQSSERPTPEQMQAIFDELDHIVEVGLLLNLTNDPGEDLDIARLRFGGAMRWMTIRGSSFPEHGRDLALEVFRPHNDWLVGAYGFTIEDVLHVGQIVTGLMTRKSNELGRAGEAAGNEHLAAGSNEREEAVARGAMAIIATWEAGVRNATTVTAEEVAASKGAPPLARVQSVLDHLSVQVGSLAADQYRGLFDETPLRIKPFLKFNDEYILTIPGAIGRDSPVLFEDALISGKPRFSQQRAKTLDQLAVRHLTALLPGATAVTNVFYEGNELDGLVLFDDVVLIVEGKGSALSVQGQRGDVRRLKRDIEDAVEDAWKQGARARDYILRQGDSVFVDEAGKEVVRIPSGAVSAVFVVNPTLHDLAGHASQLGRLRSLGLFPGQEFPWSVYINDLRVIAETCDNAAVFLHYLTWRNRLPLGMDVEVMDEVDLWSAYLNGERFGVLHDGGKMMVANSSTDFDAYYDGLAGRGPKAKRPHKFLPEPAKGFVDRLADEKPRGWREATAACLDLSIPELAALSAKWESLARQAATEGRRIVLEFGRVALIGTGSEVNPIEAIGELPLASTNATIVVVCQARRKGGTPRLAWAGYLKPVTFELSDFERRALKAVEDKQRGEVEGRDGAGGHARR